MKSFEREIIEKLIAGKVGVIPTDTLYGVVGRAEMPEAVERVYAARNRNQSKQCIVLVSSHDDLQKFGLEISSAIKNFLEEKKIWPGKVSVVLPCTHPKFDYLTRGTKTLAFRIPDVSELQSLVSQTGPLVAPSANPEGQPPAKTISEAHAYFGDTVDFYVDGGSLESLPSTLITFENEEVVVLRQGEKQIT